MKTITVAHVVDGDTLEVRPAWRRWRETGTRLRPAGYDAPELDQPGRQTAKARLERLLLGRAMALGRANQIDRGRLVNEVSLNGRNLADDLPE